MKIDDEILDIQYDKQLAYRRAHPFKESRDKDEGGTGSGNVGHSGIIGHRGGSLPKGVKNPVQNIGKKLGGLVPNQGGWANQPGMNKVAEPDNAEIGTIDTPADSAVIDMSGYSDDFTQLSLEQKMGQVSMDDINSQMRRDLEEAGEGAEVKLTPVSGELTAEMAKAITANGRATLDGYLDYLSAETYAQARDVVYNFGRIMEDTEAFKGKKAEDLDALMQDMVNKLVYQEIESVREQYTDHGIRHIVGNIDRAEAIMKALTGGELDSMTRLEIMVTMVNHDMGYTTPLVRLGGDRGIMASGEHKLYSEKLWGEQKDLWDVGKIFSEEEFGRIGSTIKDHDSTGIDIENALKTSISLSDNLALFAKEKLPAMFRHVEGSRDVLIQMTTIAKRLDRLKGDLKAGTIDQVTYDQAAVNLNSRFRDQQMRLYGMIDSTKASDAHKRDLKSAVKRSNFMTPKKSVGVLAGEITKISGKRHVNIEITFNEFDRFLQHTFEMGQAQARKVLGNYGIKDFSKDRYELSKYVTISVIGVK